MDIYQRIAAAAQSTSTSAQEAIRLARSARRISYFSLASSAVALALSIFSLIVGKV